MHLKVVFLLRYINLDVYNLPSSNSFNDDVTEVN